MCVVKFQVVQAELPSNFYRHGAIPAGEVDLMASFFKGSAGCQSGQNMPAIAGDFNEYK